MDRQRPRRTQSRNAGRFVMLLTAAFVAANLVVHAPPVSAAETSDIERLAGGDRYETSAMVSHSVANPDIPVVFVATGFDFPDGLVGAAAAGEAGGTLLMVRPDEVPSSVVSELARLRPQSIVIAGGPLAISPDLEAVLDTFTTGPVTRLGGDDRYETAALISQASFPDGADTVFVTTGESFPDTIGAVPAAVAHDAPVLLVRNGAIPASTRQELQRLDPSRVVIVGGPMTIDPSLDEQIAGLTGATTERLSGPDRFATAAAVSAATFDPVGPVAYVATGMDHPDGLVAAAAAATVGAPVLLVGPENLSSAVIAELARLAPRRVVIVGGPVAVSPDMQAQIAAAADSVRPPIVSGPYLGSTPDPATPLVVTVSITTSVPTRLSATITDGEHTWTQESGEYVAAHDEALFGFRPGGTHQIDLAVTDESGRTVGAGYTLSWTAPNLPAGFPTLSVTVGDASAMEPGLTLFPVYEFGPGGNVYVVALDAAGDVVWYHEPAELYVDIRQLPSGNLLMTRDKVEIIEMDLTGTIVRQWHAANRNSGDPGSIPVATDSFHHEVVPLTGDRYLALSSEVRSFDGYPTNETDPTPRPDPTNVVGDIAVEFAADGTVVNETKLLDILDPTRLGYGATEVTFWDAHYPEAAPTVDWSHGNAVIASGDGGMIVSLRHQDALVKIGSDGALRWILGDPNGWAPEHAPYLLTPVGPNFTWPYHQHAPEITNDGTLMVFDNHNYGAFPPDPTDPDPRSRAAEYSIDETAMTVRQVWEYAPTDLFATFIGDADALPTTSNVLTTFGGLRDAPDGSPTARLIEVSRSATPTVVWELRVEDTNPSGPGTFFIYRAERITSLTP